MSISIELKGIDIVAWWGAIVATVVLVWDIYKWKNSGPKIRFTVRPGMMIVGDPTRKGQLFISTEATNIGDRPTTITNLVIQHYISYFDMIRHRPKASMLVAEPSTAQPLPFILQPGVVWQGLAPQTLEIEQLANDGYLVCGLCHSHSEKEIDRRVIFKKKFRCITISIFWRQYRDLIIEFIRSIALGGDTGPVFASSTMSF